MFHLGREREERKGVDGHMTKLNTCIGIGALIFLFMPNQC